MDFGWTPQETGKIKMSQFWDLLGRMEDRNKETEKSDKNMLFDEKYKGK